MLLHISVIVALVATVQSNQPTPDIVYKYTSGYDLIWNDRGSGGHKDGAIWKAQNFQSEFCSLGDVATDGYAAPTVKAILVSARTAGALSAPTSFTRMWTDAGSGADLDGAVYRMNPASGYTCLGDVAMRSHSAQPNTNDYCCVKNEYVTRGDFLLAWNDRGTGANSDVSLWTTVRGADPFGLDGGNFRSVNGYGAPSVGHVLKADSVRVRDVWSLPNTDVKPLNMYEVSDLKLIWNDAGSGANVDCSIWRAESRPGYYPVGDVVVATHTKPRIGFLISPSDPDHHNFVRPPVSYSEIWNDGGSGADRDVKIWRASCPGGFVALGNVATGGGYPEVGSIYCVKSEFAQAGSNNWVNWQYIWADHGSGARRDVTMYEAKAASSSQQTVRGFGAIASHSGFPGTPYLLSKSQLTYHAEKPIEKIYMYNVHYNLDAERRDSAPVKISPTPVENFSDQTQVVHRDIGFSKTKSSTFTFSQAIQIGVSLEISAGIPLIGGSKTTVSVTTTSTFQTSTTKTTTASDSVKAIITLPPRSKTTAVITASEYKADIPFTATVKKIYFDGTEGYGTVSGVYKGVDVSEARVTFGEIEYF